MVAGSILIEDKMQIELLNDIEAAFGKVSVTPPINDVYPDFFFGIPSGVLDNVYARIGIIQASEAPVLVLAVDTLGFGLAEIAELEAMIGGATGIPPRRILITGSHSHSAPILCPVDLFGGFSPYFNGLCNRVSKLAKDLLFRMEPATLSFGKSSCDFNVNRRRMTPEGTCVSGPNPDGVVDKDVPILACHRADGSLAGVFFSYCCHPTILLGPKVSGDYPGQTQLALEARHRQSVALYLPGMFGNVRPNLSDGGNRLGNVQAIHKLRHSPISVYRNILRSKRRKRRTTRLINFFQLTVVITDVPTIMAMPFQGSSCSNIPIHTPIQTSIKGDPVCL